MCSLGLYLLEHHSLSKIAHGAFVLRVNVAFSITACNCDYLCEIHRVISKTHTAFSGTRSGALVSMVCSQRQGLFVGFIWSLDA